MVPRFAGAPVCAQQARLFAALYWPLRYELFRELEVEIASVHLASAWVISTPVK
jgi:hypothetical protein